jgi:DNA polymerase epsilon subunit 2
MFNQRYALIQQRILRDDSFQPKLVTNRLGGRSSAQNKSNGGTHTITPVESLLGRSGRRFLLGMIVQVEEGKYYLEDHTAQVPLTFTEANLLTDGFVTENCIVLIEGEAIDGVLHVHHMGSPIVEDRLHSIQTIGLQNTDIFNSIGSLSEYEKLREQEMEHGEDGMFVVLSDVYLDSPAVIEKIERMLEGYSDFNPLPIFVFMGNFTSKPLSSASQGTKAMISYFEDLANVICKFPNVANEGRFVFIPGPNDPGITGILPRGPIPNYFTAALRSKVKNVMLASNPCRMRFFTKEIVFFRDNLVSKMRRNCLIEPRQDSSGQLSSHAVKTVLDQGHLSPLPLSTSPIYWQHDHALRLYPFPDALICGDRVEQYYETYEGCDAINPGPFSNGFNFVVYRPVGETSGSQTKSDVELCEVP